MAIFIFLKLKQQIYVSQSKTAKNMGWQYGQPVATWAFFIYGPEKMGAGNGSLTS